MNGFGCIAAKKTDHFTQIYWINPSCRIHTGHVCTVAGGVDNRWQHGVDVDPCAFDLLA